MNEVSVMAAIIAQHSTATDAAKALCAAGFGASVKPIVDQHQEERLSKIETRLTRLEGWAGYCEH